MKINFLDLKAQYPLIRNEIEEKFKDIIDNWWFISWKFEQEFQQKFAEYCNVKHCITVNNWTSALILSLLANNVWHWDEVIIPVNTFIATAEAVSLVWAKPVFVDMNEYYLIDENIIEQNISKKTKVIIPVHLYWQCVNMNKILEIAKKHNLIVIEDACQSHWALYKDKKAWSMWNCGTFSFYPWKNLWAWWEWGAITTNDDKLADKLRLIRNHWSQIKYKHEIVWGNFRLDEFQCAVLSTKIKYIEKWNEMRRKNAKIYLDNINNSSVILPKIVRDNVHVWHLFVVYVNNRDRFISYLNDNWISSWIHYPSPLHLTDAYNSLWYYLWDFPISEEKSKWIVSLPMYPELTENEIKYVCEVINKF